MKLSEFIMLTEEEKRATVLEKAVAIAKREVPGFQVFLFYFPSFYVETFCSNEDKEIVEYRMFHNPDYLLPYLQEISIEQILRA